MSHFFHKGVNTLLFDRIVITCCSKFQDSRSLSAIYHLLKGKRSIQTVQDAHMYKLDKFYGIHKTLKKQEFDKQIHTLLSKNLVLLKNNSSAVPTQSGYELVNKINDMHNQLNYFNGMKYYNMDEIFFERLMLLIQTLTNSVNNNLNFIPVVDKSVITEWVREQYYLIRQNLNVYLENIHNELFELLSYFSERDASKLVDCLTGFNHYGMSSFQLADHYNVKRVEIPLILTAIIHRMLSIIEQNVGNYPILSLITRDLAEDSRITNSANQTNDLLNKQYSVEEIAVIRNLKLNTIYDHLVEIALYDEEFLLDRYVDRQHQQEILAALKKIKSYKLKEIKQEVNEKISYFEIRLVLAVENIS